jgi:hypothetical protein
LLAGKEADEPPVHNLRRIILDPLAGINDSLNS